MKTRADNEEWSPYGLEHLRQQALRRRRVLTVALMGLLVFSYFALSTPTSENELEVFGNGQKQTLEIEVPDEKEEASGPDARLQVSPGRVVSAGAGSFQDPAAAAPADEPARDVGEPVDWFYWLMILGPFILVGTLAWAGFRPRSTPTDEVNYGIYKGAMPLEMITASHAHLVVTHKRARASLFGKRRGDYVHGLSMPFTTAERDGSGGSVAAMPFTTAERDGSGGSVAGAPVRAGEYDD